MNIEAWLFRQSRICVNNERNWFFSVIKSSMNLNSCNRHANREIYCRSAMPASPMRKKAKSIRACPLQPRFRIYRRGDVALGPGKVELLALIGQTGSINQAARRMGMSYMRAWSLVQMMNRCFKQPLILVSRGGTGGGGAELTETGSKVVALYRQMEQSSLRATAAPWKSLRRRLRV
jgi:molybdate transport system regulatory protein